MQTIARLQSIGSGMHGSTFGGGPLACRVAIEFMDILDALLPHIHEMGCYFRGQARRDAEAVLVHSGSARPRSHGRSRVEFSGKQIVLDAMEQGLLMNCTHDTVLRFLPPYITTEKEIDRAVSILKRVFKLAVKRGRCPPDVIEEWDQRYRAGEQVLARPVPLVVEFTGAPGSGRGARSGLWSRPQCPVLGRARLARHRSRWIFNRHRTAAAEGNPSIDARLVDLETWRV